MYASARKMKKTKREQLQAVENMNREGIGYIMQQFNALIPEITKFQKEIFAIKSILKRKGLINELEISMEITALEELEQMKQKAIIVGG